MRQRVVFFQLATVTLLGLLAGCLPGQLVPYANPLASSRSTVPISTDQTSSSSDPLVQSSPYQVHPNPPEVRSSAVTLPSLPDQSAPAEPSPLPREQKMDSATNRVPLPAIVIGMPGQARDDSGLLEAFRRLLDKQPEEDVRRCLEKVPGDNLALLLQLLRLSARLSQPAPVDALPEKDAADLLQQVDMLAAALRKRAPLLLPKVCFCHNKIKGYGLYEPLPANPTFEGGVSGLPGERVWLYVEVRNFASRDLGEPGRHRFQTAVTPRLEIYVDTIRFSHPAPASDPPVVQIDKFRRSSENTYSLTPLNELFLGLEFNIPPNLPNGKYRLRVKVRDEVGLNTAGEPRTAHADLLFEVGSPSAGASIPGSSSRNGKE